MKANVRLLKKRRVFSEEFKRCIVNEFESGQFSVHQLGTLHGIRTHLIYRWIYNYSTFNKKGARIIEMKESSEKKVKDLEKKIKELESVVGRKQIMIDYLEKMIDVAKDELGVDIKKNFNTPRSTGSDQTGQK